jgi:hypothetical protein
MTMTRGLSFALLACIIAATALGRQWRRVPMYAVQAALLVGVVLVASSFDTSLQPPTLAVATSAPRPTAAPTTLTGRAVALSTELATTMAAPLVRPTDDGRLADIKFVLAEMDASMVAVGRGLGVPIRNPDRERIELNYLEIFYKQGIFGLLFWGAIFLYLSRLYYLTPPETKQFGLAFYLGSLFVFVANTTNPFLPGSMGMAPVFVALAALLVLSNEPRRPMQARDWYGAPSNENGRP